MNKWLYRGLLILLVPVLPFALAAAQVLAGLPEYWSDLRDCYRRVPKAFVNGGPV